VRPVVQWTLLAGGVLIELIAVLGLSVMRDPYDRLHYVGMAGFGALLTGISILVANGFSLIGDKSLVTGVLLVALGPVVVHVTARSFHTGNRSEDPGEDQP
jgi:multisubunit Na+/H+ antiporter MnhG subunit